MPQGMRMLRQHSLCTESLAPTGRTLSQSGMLTRRPPSCRRAPPARPAAPARYPWKSPLATLYAVTFTYFLALGTMMPTLPRYIAGPLHGSGVEVGAAVLTFSVASLVVRVPLVVWL